MMITRINPHRDPLGFQDEVNRLFSDFLGQPTARSASSRSWLPAVDVHEDEDGYTVQVDLPGVNPEDVKVQLVGDTLTIKGERREKGDEKHGRVHRIERVTGSFERTFRLGAPVDAGKVKAAYKGGVLEVRVPKLEEARTREIAIEVA